MRRTSQWTRIYVSYDACGEKPYYVRLVPDFMDTESTPFPHGISISGNTFATREEAEKFADVLDEFFQAMRIELITDHLRLHTENR